MRIAGVYLLGLLPLKLALPADFCRTRANTLRRLKSARRLACCLRSIGALRGCFAPLPPETRKRTAPLRTRADTRINVRAAWHGDAALALCRKMLPFARRCAPRDCVAISVRRAEEYVFAAYHLRSHLSFRTRQSRHKTCCIGRTNILRANASRQRSATARHRNAPLCAARAPLADEIFAAMRRCICARTHARRDIDAVTGALALRRDVRDINTQTSLRAPREAYSFRARCCAAGSP